ncbi:hypothetical protein AGMMS4956_18810 [Bacteroidia bacterium]|nr:hypothetical protein AGMMS4956_18810 [Bacteroidia bacterium]
MGATWFVSRAYNEYVDKRHADWQKVNPYNNRNSTFNRCRKLHPYFLKQIENMDVNNLNKNTIGIDGFTVKKMAKTTLEKIYSVNI